MDESKYQKMLSLAIFREVEAYTFYREIAEKVHNPEVKSLFDWLADQEEEHEKQLDKIRSQPILARSMAVTLDGNLLEEPEPLPKLTVDMTPDEALALAITKERQAAEFYDSLASSAEDDSIRRLCLELSKMELGHEQALKRLLSTSKTLPNWEAIALPEA